MYAIGDRVKVAAPKSKTWMFPYIGDVGTVLKCVGEKGIAQLFLVHLDGLGRNVWLKDDEIVPELWNKETDDDITGSLYRAFGDIVQSLDIWPSGLICIATAKADYMIRPFDQGVVPTVADLLYAAQYVLLREGVAYE
jgi:hypothetical protein